MNKKLTLIIGSATMLFLFIAIMGSGFILKEPLTAKDDVIENINLIEESMKKNDWKKADTQLTASKQALERVKNRIQFSVERGFIEDLDTELATLKGAIKAEDQQKVIIVIEKIKSMWEVLGQ